jgi:hypothetical protein
MSSDPDRVTPGGMALIYAVGLLALSITCVRLVGQFLAGHAVAAWKRTIRREQKQHKHDGPKK